jgi:hypothetical protein
MNDKLGVFRDVFSLWIENQDADVVLSFFKLVIMVILFQRPELFE